MANVSISNLPAATAVSGLEQIPAVQNGTTVRMTASQIASAPPVGQIYTVATLPASPSKGQSAYVTDALTVGFGLPLVGGGSVMVPCFYNGTNWVQG